MNDKSFGRVIKLQIFATTIAGAGPLSTIVYDSGYTEFSSIQKNGDPGFRIKVKCTQVQPTVGFGTNPLNISIYNLNSSSRALVQSKVGTKIAVYAGYQDQAQLITIGDILWARTKKENSDYITEIIAGDSQFAHVNGYVNQSFSGPTSYAQVITFLLAELAKNQIRTAFVAPIPAGVYNNGIVLTGSPIDRLKETCLKIGMDFNIIGGGVYITKQGQPLAFPPITISNIIDPITGLDTNTGLIGIPEVQPPGMIGVVDPSIPVGPETNISFTHLFHPRLVMLQQVNLVTKFISGLYIINRVVQDLDSWNGPFYCRCIAAKAKLPSV